MPQIHLVFKKKRNLISTPCYPLHMSVVFRSPLKPPQGRTVPLSIWFLHITNAHRGELCEKVLNLFFDLVYVFCQTPYVLLLLKLGKLLFLIYIISHEYQFLLSLYISISLYYCVLKISFVGKTRTARVKLAVKNSAHYHYTV